MPEGPHLETDTSSQVETGSPTDIHTATESSAAELGSDRESKDDYTTEQYESLTDDQRQILNRVATYLTGVGLEATDDQTLSLTFSILRPCEGCVPEEEIGENILSDIRQKFGCIYYPAVELAEETLKARGLKYHANFAFCMDIDPSCEDTTHVAVVDYSFPERPFCYLHVYEKAWRFNFATLQELVEEIQRARDTILEQYQQLVQKIELPQEGVSDARPNK